MKSGKWLFTSLSYFFIRYTNFPSNGFEMGYYLLNNDCANEESIRDLLYFLRATCQLVRIFSFYIRVRYHLSAMHQWRGGAKMSAFA